MLPREILKICCLRLHFVRFECSMLLKQAAKREFKNVDNIQTLEPQSESFLGVEITLPLYFTALENVTI